MKSISVILAHTALAAWLPLQLLAQGTAFTYQGRLNDGANPANGFFDFTFSLQADNNGAATVGAGLTRLAVPVTNGLFSVLLDFSDPNSFTGASRWLEIGVRTNGGGVFTLLAPRQALTAAPYAIRAANFSGTVGAGQLSGTVSDERLSPNVALRESENVFKGNQTISGNLGIGLAAPDYALDVLQSQAVGRFTTTDSANGAVLSLRNIAAAPTYLGAINFEHDGGTPGQIGYLASEQMAFRVGGAERMNLSTAGLAVHGTITGDGSGLTNVPGTLAAQPVSGPAVVAQPNRTYSLTGGALTTVALPATAAAGDVIQVNGFGAGGWQAEGLPGLQWTARESNRAWAGVASSADGSHLVAVAYQGQIYTSTDSGITWTARETNRNWRAVASSANGSKLVAAVDGGRLYTSADSGVTWTPRESSRRWFAVASSADGVRWVAAVAESGQLYTSTDSGVTWVPRETNRAWQAVASSADGERLVAAVYGGQLYTSADRGLTWTARDSNRSWYAVASSADGVKLVAAADNGQLYTSTDSGVTWAARESIRNWQAVASSADGTRLVAVDYDGSFAVGGQIYTSVDGGLTWTPRDSNRRWYAVASSADGNELVAAVNFGRIHTSSSIIPGLSGAVQFHYVGDNVWRAVPLTYDGSGVLSFGSTPRQMINLWNTEYGIGMQANAAYFRTGNEFLWYRGGSHRDSFGDPGPGGTQIMRLGTSGNLVIAGTLSQGSDRHIKQDFTTVNPQAVLDKVAALSIQTWTYTNDVRRRHLGPVAQDFHAAFGLNGEDDKHIATVDADGVALAAIQGLNQKLEETRAENAAWRRELSEIKQLLTKLTAKGN